MPEVESLLADLGSDEYSGAVAFLDGENPGFFVSPLEDDDPLVRLARGSDGTWTRTTLVAPAADRRVFLNSSLTVDGLDLIAVSIFSPASDETVAGLYTLAADDRLEQRSVIFDITDLWAIAAPGPGLLVGAGSDGDVDVLLLSTDTGESWEIIDSGLDDGDQIWSLTATDDEVVAHGARDDRPAAFRFPIPATS